MAYSITSNTSTLGTNSNNVLGDALPNFSISMWIKSTSTASSSTFLACKGSPAGSNGWYLFAVPSIGQLSFGINGGVYQVNATTNFYDGNWHNLIVAYDSSVGTTGYLDGSPLSFAPGAGGVPPSVSDVFYIGAPSQAELAGQFFDIRFYNKTLTSGDATTIAAGGSIGSTNLKAEWPILDSYGTTLIDATGNGNTLTFSPTPTPFSNLDIPLQFTRAIIGRVQQASNGQNGVTSLTASFSNPVTTGNSVLVLVGSSFPGSSVTSITDTASNTYTVVAGTRATNNSGYYVEFWIATNVVGGFQNVTSHISLGAGTNVISVSEYNGIDPVTPTGAVAVTNNQGPGNGISPAITTSDAASALAAGVVFAGQVPSSVDSSWSFLGVGSVWGEADYVPGAIGTYQTTFSPTETVTWGSCAVELLPFTGIRLLQTKSSSVFTITPTTIPVPINSTSAGNLLLVSISSNNPAQVFTVSDNKGNTYQHQPGFIANDGVSCQSDFFYCENAIGGVTTVTVHLSITSDGTNKSAIVQEYSGVQTSGALDTFGTTFGSATNNFPGPSLTASINDELVFSTVTLNAGVGGVNPPFIFDNATANQGIGHTIPVTPGSYQATFTTGGTRSYAITGAVFIPASATPPLTLNLSDSSSNVDSSFEGFSTTFTETTSNTDSAPQSFSVQSDAISQAVSQVPVVEALVKQILPANVKVYFRIQE